MPHDLFDLPDAFNPSSPHDAAPSHDELSSADRDVDRAIDHPGHDREAPPPRFDLRRTLLRAVEGFLDGSPEAVERAHALVKSGYRANQVTLDEIVWGPIQHVLTDFLFYEDRAYLLETQHQLTHGAPAIGRTYVNYDFRPDLSSTERVWHEHLTDLADRILAFHFTDAAGLTGVVEDWERRQATIATLEAQSPPPPHPGDELLAHLVLREATALLQVAVPRVPWHPDAGEMYVFARPPLSAYDWKRGRPRRLAGPDARVGVEIAQRLLRAIAAEGYLVITYQRLPDHYLVSLH